jgi:hypothetical protein
VGEVVGGVGVCDVVCDAVVAAAEVSASVRAYGGVAHTPHELVVRTGCTIIANALRTNGHHSHCVKLIRQASKGTTG